MSHLLKKLQTAEAGNFSHCQLAVFEEYNILAQSDLIENLEDGCADMIRDLTLSTMAVFEAPSEKQIAKAKATVAKAEKMAEKAQGLLVKARESTGRKFIKAVGSIFALIGTILATIASVITILNITGAIIGAVGLAAILGPIGTILAVVVGVIVSLYGLRQMYELMPRDTKSTDLLARAKGISNTINERYRDNPEVMETIAGLNEKIDSAMVTYKERRGQYTSTGTIEVGDAGDDFIRGV